MSLNNVRCPTEHTPKGQLLATRCFTTESIFHSAPVSPHNKKVLGWSLLADWGLSVWSTHVLSMPAGLPPGARVFSHSSKTFWIGHLKLPKGVNMNGSSPCLPCDRLGTCPGCTLPLIESQLWLTPTPGKDSCMDVLIRDVCGIHSSKQGVFLNLLPWKEEDSGFSFNLIINRIVFVLKACTLHILRLSGEV